MGTRAYVEMLEEKRLYLEQERALRPHETFEYAVLLNNAILSIREELPQHYGLSALPLVHPKPVRRSVSFDTLLNLYDA